MRRALGIVTRQSRPNACACGIDQRIGQPQVRLDEHHTARAGLASLAHGEVKAGLSTVFGHGALPAGEVPVQPSFEASHAALIVFAIERHGDGAEVREGRFWMRQAEGDHSFIDVDEALVFTEGHRIQQGFDGADPVSRTRFLFQQTGPSSRSCRHHNKVRFHVPPVLQVHASVLDGDDLRVGFDGHPDFVQGGEDAPNEVRPAGLQDQALAHVQGLSPRPEWAFDGGQSPARQESSSAHGGVI